MEEHFLVPDDVRQEGAVGKRGLADRVGREACHVEPVAGEPFGTVRQPTPVAFDMDECRLLPEGAGRRKDRHGAGAIIELRGQGGNVGNDRVLLVRIDDVAAAEFQQDLAPDVAARLLDGGRIGEADCLAVVADVDFVPAVGHEALGGGVESGPHDVADVGRDEGLEDPADPDVLLQDDG